MAEFYVFNNGLMTANTMSGSDQRAFHWSRIFSLQGHCVNVFTSLPGAQRFRSLGLNVFISGKAFLKSKIGLFLVYLSRALKSCLLESGIKFPESGVIYSSSDLLADVLPALFMKSRNQGFPLVVGMHLIAPNPFKGFKKLYCPGWKLPSLANLYYFFTQRAVLFLLKSRATLVLVSNELDRDFLLSKGFSRDKVAVTYGASDVSYGDEVLDAEKYYDAIYVGRFHEQKGFPDLLESWRGVVRELPQAKLVVIGEDISAGDIHAFVRSNAMEKNVEFLGYVGGKRKFDYVKAAKICIFPSYYESFGMVALEAMACAVPVLAYDLPVFRGIYPKGMVRVPVGDIAGLARKALELIKDDNQRRSIGKDALGISRQFSWDKTARDILGRLGL